MEEATYEISLLVWKVPTEEAADFLCELMRKSWNNRESGTSGEEAFWFLYKRVQNCSKK